MTRRLTKKIIALTLALGFLGIAGISTWVIIVTSNLPKLISVQDYEPLLVSEVFDRNNEKVGEFFREKRLIAPIDEIPKQVIHAFISAEDSSFYEHGGINYVAIFRAVIANIKAGRKVQGASTITQQVARSLVLTREKTYTRKIKEAVLAYRMEGNLTKDEIIYLYLNQIYLGHGAYGVKMAARIYFRKDLSELTVGECAILAGLPQAPTRYSPVSNPSSAKARQRYVLKRMAEEGYITEQQAEDEVNTPVKVYSQKDFRKDAPFYLETIRQILVKELGEEMVLDKGIKVYTGLDIKSQVEAQKQVRLGLRELDKRQGYRGPIGKITSPEDEEKFLLAVRDELIDDVKPERIIQPDGTFPDRGPLNLSRINKDGEPITGLPDYLALDALVKGVVKKVDDKWGLVEVWVAERRGLIDFETMKWARTPNPKVKMQYDEIEKPSEALAPGDIVEIKIVGRKFYSSRLNKELAELKRQQKGEYKEPEDLPNFAEFLEIELEQEPITQAALLSFDQQSEDIIAMVGGYDYESNKFNKTYQALRQTGSSFKALVYAAALDKGFTPATRITDSPLVYEEEQQLENSDDVTITKWKPTNYDNKFKGDILFRNSLIRSLNIPTVKIIEKVNVDWVAQYARRWGVFSPMNMDFTLALGSSSVTLYEMTKVFSQFGRGGKRIRPILIHKVVDKDGNELLKNISLDHRFEKEIESIEVEFEEKRQAFLVWKEKKERELREQELAEAKMSSGETTEGDTTSLPEMESETPAKGALANNNSNSGPEQLPQNPYLKIDFSKEPKIFFEDPNQLMDPKTAYVITSILQGVIEEAGGTGRRARALGRPVAGKTGTTNGFYDAWFVGYTPDVTTGVWVGYEQEQSLGVGEGGGSTALPIWLEYMKFIHEGLPERPFAVPEGIVFANIDNETGELATASTQQFVKQAFVEGTEPQPNNGANSVTPSDDIKDFFKQDLSE